MKRAALLLALSMVATSGCAAFAINRGVDPEAQLHDGIIALSQQNYERAHALLEPLYLEHWSERTGQRAGLALIASDLDTRNPQRRLWLAADRSARLLNVAELEPWMVPVTESYYLLAMELGAQEERLARADSARADAEQRASDLQSGRTLPQPTERTVPAQIRSITNERNALQRRVATLEEELAARDTALKETRAELERIKRTIKP